MKKDVQENPSKGLGSRNKDLSPWTNWKNPDQGQKRYDIWMWWRLFLGGIEVIIFGSENIWLWGGMGVLKLSNLE